MTAMLAAADGRSALAAAMSEDELLSRITSGTKRDPGLCAQLGLRWYHTRDSRKSPHGWPDLVIAGPRAVMFRELKSQQGTVSPTQDAWLTALRAGGLDAMVWRPSCLLDGTVATELAALAGLRGRS